MILITPFSKERETGFCCGCNQNAPSQFPSTKARNMTAQIFSKHDTLWRKCNLLSLGFEGFLDPLLASDKYEYLLSQLYASPNDVLTPKYYHPHPTPQPLPNLNPTINQRRRIWGHWAHVPPPRRFCKQTSETVSSGILERNLFKEGLSQKTN